MTSQMIELQRAVLILQLYLLFLESGTTDFNDEDRELVNLLAEHSVVKMALNSLT